MHKCIPYGKHAPVVTGLDGPQIGQPNTGGAKGAPPVAVQEKAFPLRGRGTALAVDEVLMFHLISQIMLTASPRGEAFGGAIMNEANNRKLHPIRKRFEKI